MLRNTFLTWSNSEKERSGDEFIPQKRFFHFSSFLLSLRSLYHHVSIKWWLSALQSTVGVKLSNKLSGKIKVKTPIFPFPFSLQYCRFISPCTFTELNSTLNDYFSRFTSAQKIKKLMKKYFFSNLFFCGFMSMITLLYYSLECSIPPTII